MPEREGNRYTKAINNEAGQVAGKLTELVEEIRQPDTAETLPEIVRRFVWTDNNMEAVSRKLAITPLEASSTLASLGSYGQADKDLPFDLENVQQDFSMRVLVNLPRHLLDHKSEGDK